MIYSLSVGYTFNSVFFVSQKERKKTKTWRDYIRSATHIAPSSKYGLYTCIPVMNESPHMLTLWLHL